MNHYDGGGDALGPMQQMTAAWNDYSAVCAGLPPPGLSAHMSAAPPGPAAMAVGHPSAWTSIYNVNNNVSEAAMACGHQTVLPGTGMGPGALLGANGLADLPPASITGPMSPYGASSHSAGATPVSAAPGGLDCGLAVPSSGAKAGKLGRKAPTAAAKRRRNGGHARPPSRSSSLLSNGEDAGPGGVPSLAAAVAAAASGNGPAAGNHKSCVVCSDRAVNNNFGQITCESCKAFFRRNAHKMEVSVLRRD